MICLAAFIVFAILGIFSATHRRLAKEAFWCVLRRVSFKPCQASIGEILKGKIVGWLLRRQSRWAGWVHRYFEIFSWIFVAITLVSTFYTVKGAYYYARYGTCNPEHPEQCVISTQAALEKGVINPYYCNDK